MTRQSLGEYLRHGQTPFFRLPMADLEKQGAEAYSGSDVAYLGVPFDGGTTYQPGARMAPYHLRRVSAVVESFHPKLGKDLYEVLNAVDAGNVVAPPFNSAMMRELVQVEVATMVGAKTIPMIIGGDHSVTLPCLRAVKQAYGPVAVVHLDAHFDTSAPERWGDSFHHGTPIRNALDEGLIAPGKLFQVGIRGPWKGAEDADKSKEGQAVIVDPDSFEDRGPVRVAHGIVDAVKDTPTYVTIDIDAVDPCFAPGTGTPVPGGLTSREILRFVRELAGINLVGGDLVEIAPALDHADITCLLGASILFEMTALAAARRI